MRAAVPRAGAVESEAMKASEMIDALAKRVFLRGGFEVGVVDSECGLWLPVREVRPPEKSLDGTIPPEESIVLDV